MLSLLSKGLQQGETCCTFAGRGTEEVMAALQEGAEEGRAFRSWRAREEFGWSGIPRSRIPTGMWKYCILTRKVPKAGTFCLSHTRKIKEKISNQDDKRYFPGNCRILRRQAGHSGNIAIDGAGDIRYIFDKLYIIIK